MSDRITLAELERLLADDSVSDETLAKYLKPAPQTRGKPMAVPTLVADERTVQIPPSRGIVSWSIGFLNARGERRRIQAYNEKIAAGWKGLRLLAEGDSWFLYPIVLKDVIDCLDEEFAIYSVAAAGDTLQNMVKGADRLEAMLAEQKSDGLLFSAGGNDIAGDQLLSYLQKVTDPKAEPKAYIGEAFAKFLTGIENEYDAFFTRLTKRFPDLKIFCHGYDWPFPMKDGRWLWPAMSTQNVPEATRAGVLRLMIDGFYNSLNKVAAKHPGRVFVVDCRGTVGPLAEWYDELHPRDVGFARAADKFRALIAQQFSGHKPTREAAAPLAAAAIAPSPAARAVKLQWHPHEDAMGGRVRTKIIPVGSSVSIGRHVDREVMLDDDRVSRNHARLDVTDAETVIEDLGSTNGTLLGGSRITRSVWAPGQEVRIGNFTLKLETVEAETATVMMPLVAQPAAAPAVAASQANGKAPVGVHVGPSRKLVIELACGSIVNVAAPAYVVGIFDQVRPTASRGAAREIDALTNQWLSSLAQGGTFSSEVGTISTISLDTPGLKAGVVAFAGLGNLTDFGPKSLETVGENLAKALAERALAGFATVPIGTNTGCSITDFVSHFSKGLVRGMADLKPDQIPSKITICEIDKDRFAELGRVLKGLVASDLFRNAGFEASVSEVDVGQTAARNGEDKSAVNQTLIHATSKSTSEYEFYTLPMSGAGLPVWTQLVDSGQLSELTAIIDSQSTSFDPKLGASLASLYLPSAVQDMLATRLEDPESHLLVIHDRGASSIPWEALYFNGRCPALETGISRKCLVHSSRSQHGPLPGDAVLRMLVVYPEYAGDHGLSPLPGAADEGILLARLFKENNGEVTVISGPEATKDRIFTEVAKGGYDILHYAGHAFFNPTDPRESGLLLSNQEKITAADIDRAANPPKLIFLNACESSRMRSAAPAAGGMQRQRNRIEVSGGLAEGLLSIGVENLIGTYWAVDDAAARLFAQAFYTSLLEGSSMSTALRSARKEVKEWSHAGNRMWANYLHFGDPTDKLRGRANYVA